MLGAEKNGLTTFIISNEDDYLITVQFMHFAKKIGFLLITGSLSSSLIICQFLFGYFVINNFFFSIIPVVVFMSVFILFDFIAMHGKNDIKKCYAVLYSNNLQVI